MSLKRYISDIITKDEICQWAKGEKILISAMTGSGKSQWVKNVLYETAKKNKQKILLLSNRNALKRQNQSEIGEDKSDVISLRNYQSIEQTILTRDSAVTDTFESFDYVCFDECHYWFSDSEFNRNTDILIETLRRKNPKSIYIYMTATPKVLLMYKKDFDRVYPSKDEKDQFGDYSFIEKIYFYNKQETAESILSNIPSDDKAIYFSKAIEAFEVSVSIPDSAFICSDANEEFNKRSSKTTIKEIEDTEDFSSRVLCTTTVLDTGISIKNPKVKHVVVDILDPITLVQAIGRKRIGEDEKVTVYVKNYHNGKIHFQLQLLNAKMKFVAQRLELGKEGFQKLYARKNFDSIVQNDMEINQAKLYQTKYQKGVMENMIADDDKMGYAKYVCDILKYPYSKIEWADNEFEKVDMTSVLNYFLGKRLFKGEQQEEFRKAFFDKLFSPKRNINYRRRGINSINAILEEDELPYRVISKVAYGDGKRGRRYWQVVKIGETTVEQSDGEIENIL